MPHHPKRTYATLITHAASLSAPQRPLSASFQSHSAAPSLHYKPNFYNVLFSPNYQIPNQNQKTGLFHYDALTEPFALYQLRKDAQERCEALRAEIKQYANSLDISSSGSASSSIPPIKHILNLIDEISNTLCIFLDLVEFLRNVHPDASYQNVANECWTQLHSYLHELNVDVRIHEVLRDIIGIHEMLKREGRLDEAFDSEQERVAMLLKADMEKNGGVHNQQLDSARVRELNEKIDRLMYQFVQYAHNNDQSHLPEENQLWLSTREARHLQKTLFRGSVLPVIKKRATPVQGGDSAPSILMDADYAPTLVFNTSDPEIRRKAYITSNSASPEGQQVLEQLVKARHSYAQYMKFPSYAHWAIKQNIIKTPENATRFLEQIHQVIQPKLNEELQHLKDEKLKQEGNDMLYEWDRAYYKRRAQKRMGLAQKLSQYLPLHKCLEGIYMVCEQTFSIRLEPVPMKSGEAWDPAVRKLEVIHETEGVLGYIYLDLYYRPNKVATCANFSVRVAKKLSQQKPIACMVCAFDRNETSKGDSVCLLSFSDLSTLFHEFGHALHTVLGQSNYQNTSGTRTAIDFVEMPSQFMEHFVTDYRVVQNFATHHTTGEPLPQELFQRQLAKDRSFAALEMQEQLLLSLADLKIFGPEGVHQAPSKIFREVREQFSPFPHVEGTHPESKFQHFANYAAGYYSYLYCKMCSSHIYHKYFAEDPFNRAIGEDYVSKVLRPGGSVDPYLILRDILGEEPNPKYLLRDFEMLGEENSGSAAEQV